MNRKINVHDFALAVVSGNPTKGDNPDTIAKESLELYLSALNIALKHNETVEVPKVKAKSIKGSL